MFDLSVSLDLLRCSNDWGRLLESKDKTKIGRMT